MVFPDSRKLPRVIVHADDFGIDPDQSRRILACSSACGGRGALNSLSVLVTSPRFRECVELLRPHQNDILVGLHVNLVEGPCAADCGDVPMLVDERGVFKLGFGGLLLSSVLHPRAMRRQVTCEVEAQLDLFLDAFPDSRDALRVDSHQHFHMIPAVFDSLVEAVESRGCTLEYLRVPAEPLKPFVESGVLRNVPPINWVKHVVLNGLWQLNKRKLPGLKAKAAVFCGINFSGRMTTENVSSVLAAYKEYARDHDMALELLFHPGAVEDEARCLNPNLPGFVDFYRSPNRDAEAYTLITLEPGAVAN